MAGVPLFGAGGSQCSGDGGRGPRFGWKDAFQWNRFALGLCSFKTHPVKRLQRPFPSLQSRGVFCPPVAPAACPPLCGGLAPGVPPPPCPAWPYLGEPVLVSEVGPERGPLRLALGKLGISLHPVKHTGQLPAAGAPTLPAFEHLYLPPHHHVPPISSSKSQFPTVSSPQHSLKGENNPIS